MNGVRILYDTAPMESFSGTSKQECGISKRTIPVLKPRQHSSTTPRASTTNVIATLPSAI